MKEKKRKFFHFLKSIKLNSKNTFLNILAKCVCVCVAESLSSVWFLFYRVSNSTGSLRLYIISMHIPSGVHLHTHGHGTAYGESSLTILYPVHILHTHTRARIAKKTQVIINYNLVLVYKCTIFMTT